MSLGRAWLTKYAWLAAACNLALLCGSIAAHAEEPKPSTAQPNVHVLPTPFVIPGLDRPRTVRLYLPPGYEHSRRRYPVLYMHDGQNLFDAATSYAGEWGVDETLNALAKSRGLQVIVVGIDHGGLARMRELNPWDNAEFGPGEGEQYLEFLVNVVKPWVDEHYRTLRGRRHTAIMGSSMGALISSFAISRYPQVFGAAGLFSPAYWIGPQVYDFTAAHPPPPDTRVYLYAGGSEDEWMVPNAKRMAAVLERAGLPARNLVVSVDPVGRHSEAAWRAEFPRAVAWLLRPGP